MIILLSPAKSLNEEFRKEKVGATQCQFLQESHELINSLKKMSVDDIKSLMGVSDKIAELNYHRFQVWHSDMKSNKDYEAIYLFQGDVFQGLDVESLSPKQLDFLQNNLRILSGLYGYLRPLDLIKPYRLEMGTKLVNSKGNNLYHFWQDTLTKSLQEEKPSVIINLASNEYSKSIRLKSFDVPVVTPIFKDFKGDKYKVVSFWAKKARGLMVRFICQNQITDWAKLKDFSSDGYYFSVEESTDKELVFLREH